MILINNINIIIDICFLKRPRDVTNIDINEIHFKNMLYNILPYIYIFINFCMYIPYNRFFNSSLLLLKNYILCIRELYDKNVK